jgi:hypothetical protein
MCTRKAQVIAAVAPKLDEYDLTLAVAIVVAAVAIVLALM